MEKYIKDVFARMDLQHIRAFVLTSAKELHPQAETYEMRIVQASDPISKRIDSLYSDAKELDKATTELVDALTAYQDVYFEIGVKFGARLVHQLLMSDNFTDRRQA
jgi:predicted RNA-binding protein with PIN domain